MNQLLDARVPQIEIGDISYFLYLFSFIGLLVIVILFRKSFHSRLKWVYISFFFLGIFQRSLIVFWYIYNDIYTLTSALPLQICRVVVWLIIIQCIVKKPILNHIIFYFGLFAAAAFVYPIGIWPYYNIAGIAFFIMHAMNVIFPLIMLLSGDFKPSIKGALIASGAFTVYYISILLINEWLDANYFFIHSRPFLHELSLFQYSLVNILGTTAAFIVIGVLLKWVSKYLRVVE